jgi:integrase
MASVEDRWLRPARDAETGKPALDDRGKPVMEKTNRHGKGLRWCVRWYELDGRERRQSFAKKVDADAHATTVEADKLRGVRVDLKAGTETFGVYAAQWLALQTTDPLTRENIADRLRRYVLPYALHRTQLRRVQASTIQAWLRGLPASLAESTKGVVFSHVSAILNAAVEDERIPKNPCQASSVRRPRPDAREVVPWAREWVVGMRDALPARYRPFVALGAGLGLRQGEMFGLCPDDVDWLRGWVTVQRQLKIVGNGLVLALPKSRKVRKVPLPPTVRAELAAYLSEFPAKPVTLPWETAGGRPTTVNLLVTTRQGNACNRNMINSYTWKTALAKVGIESSRANGFHALRHYYASVLLDAGENIVALSKYLGHSSPAFTLRTYTHLMPASEERTRAAVDAMWRGPSAAREAEIGGVTRQFPQNRRNSVESVPRSAS